MLCYSLGVTVLLHNPRGHFRSRLDDRFHLAQLHLLGNEQLLRCLRTPETGP